MQMRRMIESFQIKVKAKGKTIKLNMHRDKHIDVTQKRPIEHKKLTATELK